MMEYCYCYSWEITIIGIFCYLNLLGVFVCTSRVWYGPRGSLGWVEEVGMMMEVLWRMEYWM